MTLKKRFFLLIIGTVLIPNIIVILIVGFSFGGLRNIRTLHTQMRKYHEIINLLEKPVEKKDLYARLSTFPPQMNYYVMDMGRHLLNTSDRTGCLADILSRDRMFQVIAFTFTDGEKAILFVYSPVLEKYSLLQSTPLQMIAPLLLLSVLTILSFFVIKSINTSLKKIEEATRKVAEGSYDVELPVKGTDSIASLSRSFNIMVEKVREEYSRRSRFFMGVSHDLKTPLASISGYADAILEGYADDKELLDKYAGIIKNKSQLLLDRIYHLIEFVRLETGEWKMSFKDVALHKFLSEIIDTASVDAEVYHYKFESDISIKGETTVLMDIELVQRSFDNIIHNAFRYAAEGTVIRIEAEETDKAVIISVTNQGRGISESDLPYLFEPFFRGSSSRNEEGFGLGLANVAAVIKSHGWKIDVDSVPGGTTTFTIIIPLS